MGKYDDVVPRLKPEPVVDAGYQGRVEEQVAKFRAGKQAVVSRSEDAGFQLEGKSLTHVAALYKKLRAHQDSVKEVASDINLLVEAAEQMFTKQAEGEGCEGVKITGGGSLSTQQEPVAKVTDPAKFRKWCVDNGYEGLFSLAHGTANSITKQRLLDGLPEPDGVEAYTRTKVVLRK